MSENNEPTVEQLQADLAKANEKANKFQGKLTDLEKRFKGIDPQDVVGMKEELRILRDEKDQSKQKLDPEKWQKDKESEIRGTVQGELDGLKKDLEAAKSELFEVKTVDKLFQGISDLFASKTEPYVKDALRQTIGVDEDGKPFVKDDKGEKRFSSPNKEFSFQDWGKEFAEKNPFFAKSSLKGGTLENTPTNNGKAKKNLDPKVQEYIGKNKEDRAAMFKSKVEEGRFLQQHPEILNNFK